MHPTRICPCVLGPPWQVTAVDHNHGMMMALWHTRADLALVVLISLECILVYPLLEGVRQALGWKRTLPPQYRLALLVGGVIYLINLLGVLVQARTGVSLPSPTSGIQDVAVAALLYPVLAVVTWIGVLDARSAVSAWLRRHRSDRPHR